MHRGSHQAAAACDDGTPQPLPLRPQTGALNEEPSARSSDLPPSPAPLRYRLRVDPQLTAQRRERSLRSLYCCSDGVRGRRAPVTNLSHTASFHSNERIAPSNRGIKHLATVASFSAAKAAIISGGLPRQPDDVSRPPADMQRS